MKIKTSELSLAALDWAVAKALGFPVIVEEGKVYDQHLREMNVDDGDEFSPTTNWSIGGPLLQRHEIDVYCVQSASTGELLFEAEYQVGPSNRSRGKGSSMLIAGFRCLVRSKLGDEIEGVPEELMQSAPVRRMAP